MTGAVLSAFCNHLSFSPCLLQDDGDEEAPGPSQQPLQIPPLHPPEEEAPLARSTLLCSSSSDQSKMLGPKPEVLPHPSLQAQAHRTPEPHPSSPTMALDWHLLHAHAHQTEMFQKFCQELVTVHQDMADSMHVISQAVAELNSRVGQMCETLMKIRDAVQASQRGPEGVAPIDYTFKAQAPLPDPTLAPLEPAPTRTTRSRKRKHNF